MTSDDGRESLVALRTIASALNLDYDATVKRAVETCEARPEVSTAQATLLALAAIIDELSRPPLPVTTPNE